jgi:hypothetical protein
LDGTKAGERGVPAQGSSEIDFHFPHVGQVSPTPGDRPREGDLKVVKTAPSSVKGVAETKAYPASKRIKLIYTTRAGQAEWRQGMRNVDKAIAKFRAKGSKSESVNEAAALLEAREKPHWSTGDFGYQPLHVEHSIVASHHPKGHALVVNYGLGDEASQRWAHAYQGQTTHGVGRDALKRHLKKIHK